MNLTTAPLTISQLTYQIKNKLESTFSHLFIQGEITNCKLNTSGHLYFDLKDEHAKIPAVMFKGKGGKLSRIPKEGDQILARGTLSVYPPQGRYQLIVDSLEFQGVGQLLLKLEELKRKLKEKGWFAQDRKKILPKFPKHIGVVTSPTGSVIRDILHILSRRYKGFHLILNPVKVQGEGASFEIAKAIDQFNRYHLVDVIIVARGGGSLEDLWPFNEEIVAKAIFQSTIPIISAVGHETDFTIADFVADSRAPTPSAAAEIVTSETQAHLQFLKKINQTIRHTLLHKLTHFRAQIQGVSRHPILINPYLIVGNLIQKLDEMTKKIHQKNLLFIKEKEQLLVARKKELQALNPKFKILFLRQHLSQFSKRLAEIEKNYLSHQKKKVETLHKHLLSLDPKNVLKRGYSILFAQKNHSVIVSSQSVSPRDKVVALLSDGEICLSVLDE
jgi:exodeoxyribonuclease VII large subunit